jgi:hypothetical protein
MAYRPMTQTEAIKIAEHGRWDARNMDEYHPMVLVERWVNSSLRRGSIDRRLFGACQKAGVDYNATVDRILALRDAA